MAQIRSGERIERSLAVGRYGPVGDESARKTPNALNLELVSTTLYQFHDEEPRDADVFDAVLDRLEPFERR